MTSQINAAVALSVVTKGEAAYTQLRRLILLGELKPGATIQQEGLAAELGLSTTPLREALRRLEGEGLVSLDKNRRVGITPLSKAEMHDLYAVRSILDPTAAELAATALDGDAVAEVTRLAKRPIPRDIDQARALQDNREFHRAIYARCGNRVLVDILDSLWDRADRYRIHLMYDARDLRNSRREHIDIAAAIAAGQPGQVAVLMRQHVARSRELIETRATMI